MDVDKYFKDKGVELEKPCEDCGKDISHRHKRSIVCEECAYQRQLKSHREWWRRNNYSDKVQEKREDEQEESGS